MVIWKASGQLNRIGWVAWEFQIGSLKTDMVNRYICSFVPLNLLLLSRISHIMSVVGLIIIFNSSPHPLIESDNPPFKVHRMYFPNLDFFFFYFLEKALFF